MRVCYCTVFLFALSFLEASAQISIPNSNPVTQNFDGIGTTAGASLPANWKMSGAGLGTTANWTDAGNFTVTSQAASSGSPTAGGRYNWAPQFSTGDRAIGFMTDGTYTSPNSIMAFYRNTSGATIASLTVSFSVERYRTNTNTFSLAFFTSTDGVNWTARTAGDIATTVFSIGNSAYNFITQTSNSRNLTINSVNIPNNGDIYLRWVFTNTNSTNSQGMGLENVSVAAAVAPLANPNLPISCPYDFIFVLDESGSITGQGGSGATDISAALRTAAKDLVSALNGTGTRVAVVEFGSTAARGSVGGSTAYQLVDNTYITNFNSYMGPDNNSQQNANNYDPEDGISVTNWEASLNLVNTINTNDGIADLVIFITDGNPTAYTNAQGGTTSSTTDPVVIAQALAEATVAANTVKAQGSHMFVVAIPNPSVLETNVHQISDIGRYPDVDTNFVSGDYSISSSETLRDDLQRIAQSVCKVDLNLAKASVQSACSGDTVTFTLVLTNNGLDNDTNVVVTDVIPSGYTYVSDNGGAATNFAGNTLTWNLVSLGGGGISTSLQIKAVMQPTGNYTNTASAVGTQQDIDLANNTASFTVNLALNCDDGDPCTVDFCRGGICVHENTCCLTNEECADNNPCTIDTCTNGTCINTTIICNDENTCTIDRCGDAGCEFLPRIDSLQIICRDNIIVNSTPDQCQAVVNYTPPVGTSVCQTPCLDTWVRRGGGTGTDFGRGIDLDAQGNVYATGAMNGTATFGTTTLVGSGLDIYVVKYDNQGNFKWAKRAGGSGDGTTPGVSGDYSDGLATDSDGNAYVVGWFDGTVAFDAINLVSGAQSDLFIAKYDSSGNVIWAIKGGGDGLDRAVSIDIQGDDIYVTGYFENTATIGGVVLNSAGDADIFVAKFKTSGTPVWVKQIRGLAKDEGDGISVKGSKLYFTGFYSGTTYFEVDTLTGFSGRDFFVAQMDTAGNVDWVRSAGAAGDEQGLMAIADANGNVYVTGSAFTSNTFGLPFTSVGGADIFLAKYNSSGGILWLKGLGSTGADIGTDLKFSSTGKILLSATYAGSITVGSTIISNPGGAGVLIAKYDENGNFLTARSGGGTGSDIPFRMAVREGVVYSVGRFSTTGTFSANQVVSAGAEDAYVWKLCETELTTELISGLGSGAQFPEGVTTQTYVVYNDEGNSDTCSFTVTVVGDNCDDQNPCTDDACVNGVCEFVPNPVIASIAPQTVAICSGLSTQLTASGSGGSGNYTYVWNNGQTSAIITVSPTSTISFTVTVTDSRGCSASASRTVTVEQTPIASISPQNAGICNGSSITLTASGGTTYLWNTGATTPSITVSPTQTTQYSVTVFTAGGCSATAARNVSVNQSPNATISPANVSFCPGNSATLTASGGNSYVWSTGAITTSITVNPLVTTTYTVTVSNNQGCTVSVSRDVLVNGSLIGSISPDNAAVCPGQSTTLTASGGTSYLWNTGATTTSITVNPLVTSDFTVTVSNSSGCSDTLTRTVTVNSVPNAAIAPAAPQVCSGENFTLTASGGTSYLWNTGATTANLTTSVSIPANFSVTVTDENRCSATAAVLVNLIVCNDNNLCTSDNCINSNCVFTPITCNDQNACTTDGCNPQTGCTVTSIICNDQSACTNDGCNPQTGCTFTTITCNDQSACTTDACNSQIGCTTTPVVCNDGNACTTDGCNRQTGCTTSEVICNDQNACTTDGCNPQTGCTTTPVVCNDGNACTTDACNPQTGCTTTPVVCNDGNACTTDACNPQTGCTTTPVVCNDGNACTTDACNPQTGCTTTPVVCNDGNACTTDGCNTQTGCTTTPVICNDGNACTTDACNPQTGCTTTPVVCNDGNACTTDACSPQTGCTTTPVVCNDQSACTSDRCDTQIGCVFTTVNCNDGNACTADACLPASGCINSTIICNDGSACTTNACDIQIGCVFTTITCTDGSACTTDGCSLQTGCTFTPVNCNDNNACTTETCDPQIGCVYLTVECNDNNACTNDICIQQLGCRHIVINCNDQNACTNDGCNTVRGCVYNVVICNDQNACTTEGCNPSTGCFTTTVNCNDSNPCTQDTCSAQQGCFYFPTDCNDSDPCTVDACNSQTGCTNTPLNCADTDLCTTDKCIDGTCVHIPVLCDDGDLCTDDACVLGECQFVSIVCNDDDLCTDDFCQNGNCVFETVSCDDQNPCTEDFCVNDACQHLTIQGCCLNDAECDDNELCTSNLCNGFRCYFVAPCCNDDNPCTYDFCLNGICVADGIFCDDGDLCTQNLCEDGICSYPQINCSDNDACTIDGCVGEGICTHTPVNCNDGNACTTDFCYLSGLCQYLPVVCDDLNFCTTDICIQGQCLNTPITCTDGDLCTDDFCVEGDCVFLPVECNDNDVCTFNICVDGACTHPAISCDDNNFCTMDACGPNGCFYTPVVCNDNDLCTVDRCINGACDYTPQECSDGNACTYDICVDGICSHPLVVCDDGIECTADACVNGTCVTTPGQINVDIQKTDMSCGCVNPNQLCLLNFAGLPSGTILGEQYANYGIHISAQANAPGKNFAIIFDSYASGTPDPDLEVDYGNLMVIARDVIDINPANGLVDKPNDNSTGGTITLLFDSPRTIESFDFVDEEEPGTFAFAYDAFDNLIAFAAVPALGNATIQTIPFAASGVRKLVFSIDGSGAVTNIVFGDCCCDGAATATATGGTAPYLFEWSNGVVGSGINELCPDEYCVTVTDANGCFAVSCIDIVQGGSGCDDGDSCTTDECVNSTCVNIPIPGCEVAEPCTSEITGYTLVYESMLGEIGPLADGQVINRDELCRFNIRADFCGDQISSVKFILNGSTFRVENDVPYALAGDNPTWDYHVWIPAPGNYTMTAIPYSQDFGNGTAGISLTINFTVIDNTPNENENCVNPPIVDCNGDVNGTAFIDACNFCVWGNTGIPPNSLCPCDEEAQIFVNELPVLCQGSVLLLKADAPGAASYLWSTGETTMEIVGQPDGVYSVTATNAFGCEAIDTQTTPPASSLLSAYVMLAENSIALDKNKVFLGGAGARAVTGTITLDDFTQVTTPNTFVRAANIFVNGGSAATSQFNAPANIPLPAFESNVAVGGAAVVVPANTVLTLNNAVYGGIQIDSNSTVTFTQAGIDIDSLITGKNVTIRFESACVKLRIRNRIVLGEHNDFNADTTAEVKIFAEGNTTVGSRVKLIADIYTLGTLQTLAGISTDYTTMIGFYIANTITGGEYTGWYWNPTCGCSGSGGPRGDAKMGGVQQLEVVQQEDKVLVRSYPNPFSEKLNVEFSVPVDSKARLDIFSSNGKKIATLFDGQVKAAELRKVEYNPTTAANGLVLYRLQTNKGVYYGKAVMVK